MILYMDDVVRISRSLYAVLSKIIGSDEEVYIRRTATNLRDDIIRMEKEWTNAELIPCYSGSKAEGLRFKSSDEDWMYIYRHIKVVPPDSFISLYDVNISLTFVMENEMTKPGFTLLKLAEIEYGKTYMHKGNGSLSPIVPMLNGRYISSKLWREINAQSGCHGHTIVLHGPCTSGFIFREEYDWAHCLKCNEWPKNARSSVQRLHQCLWPSYDTIQYIVNDGVLFVPIGAKQSFFEDTEWRMSFSLAEKRLIHSMNHTQFLCYGLLKLFLKEVVDTNEDVKGLLCSYFLKTALFWEITTSPNQWNTSSLLSCFWKCFCRLLQWVNSSYCPNFFIPENNMFQGKIEGDNRNKLLQSPQQFIPGRIQVPVEVSLSHSMPHVKGNEWALAIMPVCLHLRGLCCQIYYQWRTNIISWSAKLSYNEQWNPVSRARAINAYHKQQPSEFSYKELVV